MPHIARALKSFFSSAEECPVQMSGSVVPKQVLASFQQRLSSDLIDNASELYSKASLHLSNLTRDKSKGELFFIATILVTVILFVIILPTYEAFFPRRAIHSEVLIVTKSLSSPSSSTTDSLQTIEESEDEDLAMPIEKDEIVELAQPESFQDIQVGLSQQVAVQDMQDIIKTSVGLVEQTLNPPSERPLDFANSLEGEVYDADEAEEIVVAHKKEGVVDADLKGAVDDADDKHSNVTPATVDEGLETPTSSLISHDYVRPVLIKDYVSVPNVALQKRSSSFGKLGKRLSSTRLGLGRKDSSDASVSSTSSFRKLSIRGFGKKKGQGVC